MTLDAPSLLLADADTAVLVSWWKMLAIFVPFVPWAWLVSSRLDKDARYFHLNQRRWNGIHLGAGVAALLAMLFVPIFWIGWPLGVIILVGPVLVYWYVRNASVPEDQKFSLTSREGLAARMEARRLAKAAKDALIQFTDHEGTSRPLPSREHELYPVHMAAEDLLGPAVAARATRVDLAVSVNGATVHQVIDGVRYKREPLPTEQAIALTDYIKDLAGLDVQDRRRRQSGTLGMRGPNGTTEVHVTTAGSSSGQVLRAEFDRESRLVKPFDGLGLLPAQLEGLRALEVPADRHGVVLLAAPPSNGLSTSRYSFVGRHDAYTSNIKTLERDIEARIDGVDQATFDAGNTDVDYATHLQSILRRDPDIVMFDELKDAETARIAAEPGLQGPLIYVPLRAGTTDEAIAAWVKAVGDVKKATRTLRAVVTQRLLRTLCPNCRQPFEPTADQLRRLNLPPGKVSRLFAASGKVQVKNKIENCPVCGGTGYLGQTGAFQVLVVDDETRKLLAAKDLKGALAHARRNKMIYLQEAALSKVLSGETTIEEVIRVTAPKRASEAGASSSAA